MAHGKVATPDVEKCPKDASEPFASSPKQYLGPLLEKPSYFCQLIVEDFELLQALNIYYYQRELCDLGYELVGSDGPRDDSAEGGNHPSGSSSQASLSSANVNSNNPSIKSIAKLRETLQGYCESPSIP